MRIFRLTAIGSKPYNMSYYISELEPSISWFEAFTFCKSVGMDLYSPDNGDVNLQLIDWLDATDYQSTFWVGGSRIGTSCFWYSSTTGYEIDSSLFRVSGNFDYREKCLQFTKSNSYAISTCNCDYSSNFICQVRELV